jgi:ribonuclease P protein component
MHMPSKDKMVGYAVSKKIQTAVSRNKIKRRLRVAFRGEERFLKNGLYLLVAKQNSTLLPFSKICEDIKKTLLMFYAADGTVHSTH